MELADVPDSKSGPGDRVRVRPPPPAPRRRGLCIVRDDFSFEKSSAHSRRRSSFSAKSPAAPALLACNRARNAPACYQLFAGSSLFRNFLPISFSLSLYKSEQSQLCSDLFFTCGFKISQQTSPLLFLAAKNLTLCSTVQLQMSARWFFLFQNKRPLFSSFLIPPFQPRSSAVN